MFNDWEKRLRQLIANCLKWTFDPVVVDKAVWDATFDELVNLFEQFGWKVREEDFWNKLQDCANIINVHKHGDGRSFRELQNNRPEYFYRRYDSLDNPTSVSKISYSDLEIGPKVLRELCDCLVDFWNKFPLIVRSSEPNIKLGKQTLASLLVQNGQTRFPL